MKKAILSLFIIILLPLAGLSLAMMSHSGGHGHNQCPFEAATVVDCTSVRNPVDFLTFHIGAFAKMFSSTQVVSFASWLAVLFAALFLLAFSPGGLFGFIRPRYAFLYSRNRIHTPKRDYLFANWFSLHENSPTHL